MFVHGCNNVFKIHQLIAINNSPDSLKYLVKLKSELFWSATSVSVGQVDVTFKSSSLEISLSRESSQLVRLMRPNKVKTSHSDLLVGAL